MVDENSSTAPNTADLPQGRSWPGLMAQARGGGEGQDVRELRSGAAVFQLGPDGRILSWNRAAERLTGIPAGDAEGRPCWEVLGGRDDAGGLVCHPGCSAARLAREAWPVRSIELSVRTPLGPKRLTVETIVLHDDDETLILHPMHESQPAGAERPGQPRPELTPRQREVLLLLAEGIRAKEIAARLTLSETTVRNHISSVLAALGVHSQLEAVARARRLALVDDSAA